MKIEQIKPTVLRVTLHAYELAALTSAARWVIEGAEGELPDEAIEQLEKVLEKYDSESKGMADRPGS